jgi:prepilin-type N-terminal cleavage/methylation domain-containing protein
MMNERGFTLLELLISASIIGVLAIVITNFYSNQLVNYARAETNTILQSNTKQAVETMEKDIKSAQAVESVNRWPDTHGPVSGNSFSWASDSDTIVMAVPAQDASGNLLYADSLRNVLQTNDVVFYIEPATNILYRRLIANPVAGNAAKTTCPPAVATSTCPADGKVVEDVAQLSAVYYDNSNAVTSTPANAGSVQITLQQSRAKFGKTYRSILTSQATLRNK